MSMADRVLLAQLDFDQPEEPARFQRNWISECIWAFREKMIAEYRTAEQIAADDMIMAAAEEAEGS